MATGQGVTAGRMFGQPRPAGARGGVPPGTPWRRVASAGQPPPAGRPTDTSDPGGCRAGPPPGRPSNAPPLLRAQRRPAATRAPCGHPGALRPPGRPAATRAPWAPGVCSGVWVSHTLTRRRPAGRASAPPGRAGQRAARPAGPRFIMTLALVQAPAHSQGAQAALKAHTGKAGRAGRRTQRTHRQSRAGGAPHADPAMINTGTQSKIRAGRRRGEGKNVCGRCAARTPFYLSTNVFAAGFARPLLLLTV